MEDRIIGSLSPIQFGILVLGGLASFLTFTSTSLPDPGNKVLGSIFSLFTLAMALGKFNDRPLYSFARYIIQFITSPKMRVWRKAAATETLVIKPNPSLASQQVVHVVKHVKKADIAQLATVLDSRGTAGSAPSILSNNVKGKK